MKEIERLAAGYREMAEECMAEAESLIGEGTLSDRAFLESMARKDRLIDHDDNCGHCYTLVCMAEAARYLLAEGEILDGIAKWNDEFERRWHDSKYFKLYQAEVEAGRDPKKAFTERGWEM
jgi:hypothetical protein